MSSESLIDDDVKNFIRNVIDSFEHMEILLLLHSNPAQEWTAQEVCNRLRNDYGSAVNRLADLASKGLLKIRCDSENHFQFSPKNDMMQRTVDGLAKAYLERRVTIINLIFSKPHNKIQIFANAFKIRKD